MNLNEAFAYQSILSRIINECHDKMSDEINHYTVTRHHAISSVHSDKEDYTETDTPAEKYDINAVIKLMTEAIEARQTLSLAITAAKNSLDDFDLDAAVATNKSRNYCLDALTSMTRSKARESKTTGRSYVFNQEGNQTPVIYDVTVKHTLDFDMAKIKDLRMTLSRQAREVSSKIDTVMVTTTVDFTPPWDPSETFDDIIQRITDQTGQEPQASGPGQA